MFRERIVRAGLQCHLFLSLLKRTAIIDELAQRKIFDEAFFTDLKFNRDDFSALLAKGNISENSYNYLNSVMDELEEKARREESISDEIGSLEGYLEGLMWQFFTRSLSTVFR